MGGFTENPPPPAPDYPPENAFDVQALTGQIVKTLKEAQVPGADTGSLSNAIADGILKFLHWSMKTNPMFLPFLPLLGAEPEAAMQKLAKIIGEILLKVAAGGFGPAMEILSQLTTLYVTQFVTGQTEIRRGESDAHPSGLKPAAAGMFDSILAPLAGLYGARNPATPGAGEVNSQFALGSIISIHLNTWLINIISNITGLGVLKFINSFDDVITTSLNSRSLGRIALKPYLEKFMGDPLTRDLNMKIPLEISSPSTLLKSYLRGALDRNDLHTKMRGKGFAEEITAQLLLDAARLLGLDEVKWLVDHDLWTHDQAITHLQQQGYPDTLAPTVLEYALSSLVRSNMLSLANSLVSAAADHRLDNPTLRYLLKQAGFNADEVNAFATRAAVLGELSKPLSYAQVRQLFQESLVDLNYVLRFLKEEGYADDDADLLVLLEFVKKDERNQLKAQLLERRRVSLEAALGMKAQADAARAAELAALGGPTS